MHPISPKFDALHMCSTPHLYLPSLPTPPHLDHLPMNAPLQASARKHAGTFLPPCLPRSP